MQRYGQGLHKWEWSHRFCKSTQRVNQAAPARLILSLKWDTGRKAGALVWRQGLMTCLIQEPDNRFFLSTDGTWTSDIRQAIEFVSIHDALGHKGMLGLDYAHVLVFRDKRVYRVDSNEIVPLV